LKSKQRDCGVNRFSNDVKRGVSVSAQMNLQVIDIKERELILRLKEIKMNE
jgi:hypothetical protein